MALLQRFPHLHQILHAGPHRRRHGPLQPRHGERRIRHLRDFLRRTKDQSVLEGGALVYRYNSCQAMDNDVDLLHSEEQAA